MQHTDTYDDVSSSLMAPSTKLHRWADIHSHYAEKEEKEESTKRLSNIASDGRTADLFVSTSTPLC